MADSVQIRISPEARERLEKLLLTAPGIGRSVGEAVNLLSLASPENVLRIVSDAYQRKAKGNTK